MTEIEDIRIWAIFRSRALDRSRSRLNNLPNQSIGKNALVLQREASHAALTEES
jgi:hypothetical protein